MKTENFRMKIQRPRNQLNYEIEFTNEFSFNVLKDTEISRVFRAIQNEYQVIDFFELLKLYYMLIVIYDYMNLNTSIEILLQSKVIIESDIPYLIFYCESDSQHDIQFINTLINSEINIGYDSSLLFTRP